MLSVQTRDEQGHCATHNTVQAAFEAADEDPEIWKISWTVAETGERVRFTRQDTQHGTAWVWDPIVLPNEHLPRYHPKPPVQGTIIP